MTIDDPSSPPRTRREARAQTGSHRGVDSTGMDAFLQGAGGAPHDAGHRGATELPGGGQATPDDVDGPEEPLTSTAMLRTLFAQPDDEDEPEPAAPAGSDAFSRAMFGAPAAQDSTAPVSPAQPVPAPASASGAGAATGLAAVFGGAPAETGVPESAPFDAADDTTREAPVITGVPGWNDGTAARGPLFDTVDTSPTPSSDASSGPADDDDARLSASLAFFAAADAAAAAGTAGATSGASGATSGVVGGASGLADTATGLAGTVPGAAGTASAASADVTADGMTGTASAVIAGAAAAGVAGTTSDLADPASTASAVASPVSPTATAPVELAGLGLDVEVETDTGIDVEPAIGTHVAWADSTRPATALTWVDTAAVQARTRPSTLQVRTLADDEPDLLSGMRRTRAWLRPRVLIPCGVVVALVGTYCASTLLAPLDNVAPTIEPVAVQIAPAPVAAVTWPENGTSAVDVLGFATATSSGERIPIASVSKVASVLMVLEKMPLELGEQGPSFDFDRSDGREYWQYVRSNQSALDVPVGGSLTEYQMLQGILLGSANNYIDRLADEIWGSKSEFADAAAQWLSAQGLDDTTIISPSGRDDRNRSTSSDMIDLAELAMRNPVFAEIVGTKSADIPGAGVVKNSNTMLHEDPGVTGLKTGTLGEDYNLLTAKDVKVGDATVHLYAVALGQESNEERVDANRALYAQVEKTLADQAATVPKGTVVGTVDTIWGESSDVITDSDAKVVMWNGSTAEATSSLDLGDAQKAGTKVGSLSVAGAIDTAKTDVSLKSSMSAPSAWWRLTHPLELFGLDG